MKLITFLFLLFVTLQVRSQNDTINLESKINSVTVFYSGAQILRISDYSFKKGKYILQFKNLPPDIFPNSVQVEGNQYNKILAVKTETVSGKNKESENKFLDIQKQMEVLDSRIAELNSKLEVYKIEERLLIDNIVLPKPNNGSATTELQSAADFYRKRLTEIKLAQLDLKISLVDLDKKKEELSIKINKITAENYHFSSQIIIHVEVFSDNQDALKFKYFVPKAGWQPTYDFRVDDISKPLNLVYNANVYQNTGEDWNQVQLTLSASNPSHSGKSVEIVPWIIQKGQPEYRPIVQLSDLNRAC